MRQSLGWVSNFRRAKCCARDHGCLVAISSHKAACYSLNRHSVVQVE
jgi:hypothetical protein